MHYSPFNEGAVKIFQELIYILQMVSVTSNFQ